MASMDNYLQKLREDRIAREKARIDKLREINLNKYGKNEPRATKSVTNIPVANKPKSKPTIKNMPKYPKNIPFFSQTKNTKLVNDKKSIQSQSKPKNYIKQNGDRESVFDRLYKPKIVQKEVVDNALKLKTDPTFLKKNIKDSRQLLNKRQTLLEVKETAPVRRSISAVHFKRISKNELSNCVHKWASIGEKINKAHVKDVNEDDSVKDEKIQLTVQSERKKVQFQTPKCFNSPRPEELQARLQKWLQKRGKSMDSYHHLQCFGLHHLSSNDIIPKSFGTPKFDLYDDDNKENIALEHDSDNDSYIENINNKEDVLNKDSKVQFPADKWRRASYASGSVDNESYETTLTSGEAMHHDFNESYETTLTSGEAMHHVDELLLGALNDLTELLREGFDWEQCARWLRAIRDRFPSAPESAPYWECRAALEEHRGDLPASVQCWEQAIAKGTEHSVVEANLDQLLDKFMQLKISPGGGRRQTVDPKLLDVKNVFKSTIIRFAVQQAKLRQSNGTPKFTVTPVRRSSRLSVHSRQTPLRICATLHQAASLGPTEFKPNKALTDTP